MLKTCGATLSCACALLLTTASAYSYPEDFLARDSGVTITTKSRLAGRGDPNALRSDGVVGGGRVTFAQAAQPRSFVVDLGLERTFDRVQIGVGGIDDVAVGISKTGADGPFETIFRKGSLGAFQVLRLPLTNARWAQFDFGDGSGGGVREMRIYKGYEHPKLEEVTKLLYERIRPGLPELASFYAAAEAGDWPKACAQLRAYYKQKQNVDPAPDPANMTKEQLDARKQLLDRAEELASGKLGFAGITRQETVPIDWSYQKTGDWYEHKNFLNRGSPLGVPIEAYHTTGDKRWADEFRKIFYDWVDANPKPVVMRGADYPTWRTLDSAARVNWLASRFGKAAAGKDIEDELWANLLYTVWEHADYIKNDDFTGGNWLAMSSSCVASLADQFPEFKDQPIWQAYGGSSLEKNVMRDVHPDGKEMEDAPGYICFAYNGMLSSLQAMDKAGKPVKPEVRERLNRTQDFLIAVTQPDGNMPAIGDWGGGAPYALNHALPVFNREDVRYTLTNGKEGVKPGFTSINFPYGGWSIMRSSYDEQPPENARHLVFKSSSGAHGHEDTLMITNYAYGRELLVDCGVRSYESGDRFYSTTPYHNTVCVDGKNTEPKRGKTEKWVSNDGLDYVFGTNQGYPGATHRRAIIFVKPDYWIIHDDVIGEGEHTSDQNWHFAPEAGLTEDPTTRAVRTNFNAGGNLLMLPVETAGLKSESIEFYIATRRMTADSGQTTSKGWKYGKSGPTPQVFDLLMYPYQGPQPPSLSVRRLALDGVAPTDATALEVKIGDLRDYVLVSHTGVRKMGPRDAKISVNGEMAVVRTKAGKPLRVSGSNVTAVYFGGKRLFKQDEPAKDVDVLLAAGKSR